MDESHLSEREFPYAWENKTNFSNQGLANCSRVFQSVFPVPELGFSKPEHDPGLLFRGPGVYRPTHNIFGDSGQSSHDLGSGLCGFHPGHDCRNIWGGFGQTHPKSSQDYKDPFSESIYGEFEPGFNPGFDFKPKSPLHPDFAEIKLLRDIWIKTWDDHNASRPFKQFQVQIEEETTRVGHTPGDQIEIEPTGEVYSKLAYENVKNRWIQQGIWRKGWKGYWLKGPWRHEESIGSGTESEQESTGNGQMHGVHSYQEEERQERRALKKELSRPFHQFVYQVLAGKIRTEEHMDEGEGMEWGRKGTEFPYLSTVAYKTVKETWVKRGLWSKTWGRLPGRFWKHERPFIETAGTKLWEGSEMISFPTRLYFPFTINELQARRPLYPVQK